MFLFFSSYLIVLLNLIIYVLKKEETLSILYVFFLNFKKASNWKSASSLFIFSWVNAEIIFLAIKLSTKTKKEKQAGPKTRPIYKQILFKNANAQPNPQVVFSANNNPFGHHLKETIFKTTWSYENFSGEKLASRW